MRKGVFVYGGVSRGVSVYVQGCMWCVYTEMYM